MTTHKFRKDESGDRLLEHWMPGGRVHKENAAKLKSFMKNNKLDTVSIPLLINSATHASARQKAVKDLAIPEVKK